MSTKIPGKSGRTVLKAGAEKKQQRYKTSTEDFSLEDYWPFLLGVIANTISNSTSKVYRKKFGVGIAEWRAISTIAAYGQLTANVICRIVGQDKAAISRALRKLEDDGYVESAKKNGSKRLRPFRLTRRGKNLYKKMLRIAVVRHESLRSNFSEAEARQLTDFLHRLKDGLPDLIGAMDNIAKE